MQLVERYPDSCTIVVKYAEDQLRDERGRWTDTGGGGTATATEDTPAETSIREQLNYLNTPMPIEAAKSVLQNGGFRVQPFDAAVLNRDPAVLEAAVRQSAPTEVPRAVLLQLQGASEALADLQTDSPGNDILREYVREHVPISLVAFNEQAIGAMTCYNSSTKTIGLVFNADARLDILTPEYLVSHADVTVANQLAAAEWERSHNLDSTMRVMGKAILWHELGHVADILTGQELCRTMEQAIASGRARLTARDATYLQSQLSHYAMSSLAETVAEWVCSVQASRPLKGRLKAMTQAWQEARHT